MSSDQASHFWLMVIHTPRTDGRTHVGTYTGTITPKRGESRLDLFNYLRGYCYAKYPDSQDGSVTAFDIQPNKI